MEAEPCVKGSLRTDTLRRFDERSSESDAAALFALRLLSMVMPSIEIAATGT